MKGTVNQRMALLAVFLFFSICGFSQNYSLRFDGGSERVGIGNTSYLNSNHVSVEFWMKASTGTYPYSNPIDKSHEATTKKNWGFEFDGSGQKLSFWYGNGSVMEEVQSTANLDDNTWHHIAATYDGSKCILYVDGTAVDSNTNITGNLSHSSDSLYFGAWKGSGRWFPGDIEEVRIWNTAITKKAINHFMEIELTTDHEFYSNLVAYYQMSDGSGNSLTDNSPYSHTGKLINMNNPNWIGATPLPLELLYFTSQCNGNGTELNWATASEVNVSHFEIYTSSNGVDFELLTTLQAEGNSNQVVEYSYFVSQTDANYYFLKEVDVDGSIYDLSMIYHDCMDKEPESFSLYPNPAVNDLHIEISESQLNSNFIIYDVNGMHVYQQKLTEISNTIDVGNHLSSGVYFVQVSGVNGIQNRKLIIK